MARYEITMANGYGREIDSMVVEAASMAVALTLSGNLLHTGAVQDGDQAVSATIELLGVYEHELPGGTITCPRCGAVFAWEGEEPLDCLRCGLPLAESRALATLGAYACTPDESAGQAELHSVRSELHEIDRPDVGRAERLAAELRAELDGIDGGGK